MKKPRPNDPCPCGSGRKFKKCHALASVPLTASSSIKPTVAGLLARGSQLAAEAKLEQAEHCYQQALRLAPDSAEAWIALGNLAERAGDWDAARECYASFVRLRPALAAGYFALGNMHSRLYAFDLARRDYLRAVELEPGHVGAWCNLGNIEKYFGRFAEALGCYRQAIEHEADIAQKARHHSNLLQSLHYDEGLSHEALFAAHREWALSYARPFYPAHPAWPNSPGMDRPLRIGYVSGSFTDTRIMGYFLQGVLEQHDRSRFRIYLYSSAPGQATRGSKLRLQADEWIEIAQMQDSDAARRIKDDMIDILVDLDGHNPMGHPLIFAHKPAPVQVEWLDWFNTSGMDTIDYILTDPYTTPENSPQRFSEIPVRLPNSRFCYKPVDHAPPVASMPCLMGAPFTFGSFNRHDKLSPAVLSIWADILHAIPDSRLLLKNRALQVPALREELQRNFDKLGILPERLLFRGPSPHADMLQEYGDMDVALDTFPFNGGLTTCECLWMGVPIIALEGERMIGRQTSSMLRLLGLEDWVVQSPEAYVRLAVEKYRKREAVAQLRSGLRHLMARSPLCDAPGFARDLESAYRTMWKRYSEQSAGTASFGGSSGFCMGNTRLSIRPDREHVIPAQAGIQQDEHSAKRTKP